MAINILWATREIFVPRADMLLLQTTPVEIRQLDLNELRARLRDLEDDEEGIAFPVTHRYAQPTPIGGVTLAPVIEILEPYTVTFEDGQYAVNVVGGNTNIADRVNINQVSIRTSNSAGLQELTSLQAASYDGQMVAVSQSSSITGTIFPKGTRTFPVNNFADAKAIADARGFGGFIVMGAATLAAGEFISGYTFRGDNAITTMLTMEEAADTTNAVFENLYITGTLDGNNVFRDCRIGNVNYVSGVLYNCGVEGLITMNPGSILAITESSSGVAQTTIDLGVSGSLYVRGFSGTITLRNFAGGTDTFGRPARVVLDMDQGEVIVDADVTGTVLVRGIAKVTNNAGENVIDETVGMVGGSGGTASVDPISMREIKQAIQGAIPTPTSPWAIWDAAPAHLKKKLKAKDYSDDIRGLRNQIDGLAQLLLEKPNTPVQISSPRVDLSALEDRLDALAQAAPAQPSDGGLGAEDFNEAIAGIRSELADIQLAVLGTREDVSRLPTEIPSVDLSEVATKTELAAISSLLKKLENYDDSDVKALLSDLVDNRGTVGTIDRKLDLVLDNQLDQIRRVYE